MPEYSQPRRPSLPRPAQYVWVRGLVHQAGDLLFSAQLSAQGVARAQVVSGVAAYDVLQLHPVDPEREVVM